MSGDFEEMLNKVLLKIGTACRDLAVASDQLRLALEKLPARDAEQRDEAERGTGSDKPADTNEGGVFSLPECIFNYCPNEGTCRSHGCMHPAE